LTYSIIKHQYPSIHDGVKQIARRAGRIAGEVDLVLAALRVAKVTARWDGARDWEILSRPTPAFVSDLPDPSKRPVLEKFMSMIQRADDSGGLAKTLSSVREALLYDRSTNGGGLPPMLVARLPRSLVEALILFADKSEAREAWPEDVRRGLRAFALHWLLFVG